MEKDEDYNELFSKMSEQLATEDFSSTHIPELPEPSSTPLALSRFTEPKTDKEIAEARQDAIPKRTRQDTNYCVRVWDAWRGNRNSQGSNIPLLNEMDSKVQAYWLSRSVLEARKVDGSEYPPNTLHHIVSGIMRHVRCTTKPEIDFFNDVEFKSFVSTLNAEMKHLQSRGIGTKQKQAEPLTEEEEELLLDNKILGDHDPQSLLNTMIFMNDLYFALRSGDEHRNLRHSSCQISIVEERAYLEYREDISKNHPGGLKGRKVKPKVVTHHENLDNPARCFVRLFKKYRELCPKDVPPKAFYPKALQKPREDCWYFGKK